MKLKYINAGSFEMGDTFDEGKSDEKPVHTVHLPSFWLGKTEVTNAEYSKFLNEYGSEKVKSGEYAGQTMIEESSGSRNWDLKKTGNKWQPVSGYEKHPVIYVTWYGANEFCQYNGGSLPTEAQWEYAAREGGKKVRFGNGKDILDAKEANFDGRKGHKQPYSVAGEYREKTTAVGSFAPNALGLYDMSGNVWEWCADWYEADFYASEKAKKPNPINNRDNYYRLIRGGCWFNNPYNCRAAYRGRLSPGLRYNYIGFRFACNK